MKKITATLKETVISMLNGHRLKTAMSLLTKANTAMITISGNPIIIFTKLIALPFPKICQD